MYQFLKISNCSISAQLLIFNLTNITKEFPSDFNCFCLLECVKNNLMWQLNVVRVFMNEKCSLRWTHQKGQSACRYLKYPLYALCMSKTNCKDISIFYMHNLQLVYMTIRIYKLYNIKYKYKNKIKNCPLMSTRFAY